jgi:ABC-type transport system involved in multi-copper enzyme maturation permease subunit
MRARLVAVTTGIGAVGSKELRGRMRGPRAFIALTLYLALLAGFTVMIYLLAAQSAASQAAFGGGNPYASASVGQAVFTVLLFLQILLVVFLAPAATAGAISLEREKQTLDLLTATPISTLGIVLGKLGSALAFVGVLILASVPLTAVVFVFGGVGPEDVIRGYVVLLVTALGFGSVGILLSSVTRRTQSATVLTYLVVLVLTVGTGFAWFFWDQMAGTVPVAQPFVRDLPANVGGGDAGSEAELLSGIAPEPTAVPTPLRPPEAILWLNPVVAAADVVCGMDVNPYSVACQLISQVTGSVPGGDQTQTVGPVPMPAQPGIGVGGGVAAPDVVGNAWGMNVVDSTLVAADDPFASSSTRDSFWPRAAAAWLVVSLVLVVLTVQMVSPTRRWRIFRRRSRPGAWS